MASLNQPDFETLLKSHKELLALQRQHNPDRDTSFSRIEEAQRRFSAAKSLKQKMEVIDKITDETIKEMNPPLLKILQKLSGNDWPRYLRPCMAYNNDCCDKQFYHMVGKEGRQMPVIHACLLCNKITNGAFNHKLINCTILKLADDNLATDSHQIVIEDEPIEIQQD